MSGEILNNLINITYEDDTPVTPLVLSIGKITGFNGIDGEAADIDTTTFDSTFKEWCQGLPDAGNISIDVVRDFDNTGQAALLDAMENQNTREMVITMPSGTINTITFQAYVKSFNVDGGSYEEALRGTVNLKISGQPVYSAV